MRVYSVKNAIGWGGLDVSSFDFDCHFDFDWGGGVLRMGGVAGWGQSEQPGKTSEVFFSPGPVNF